MRKSVIRGLIVANLLLASAASARQIENWSYERLFEEADVVIIAGAIKTVPTDATWTETLFEPLPGCYGIRSLGEIQK